jgi:hypothetical protein
MIWEIPPQKCFYEGILFALLDETSGHGNLLVLMKLFSTTECRNVHNVKKRVRSGVTHHVVLSFENLVDLLLVSALN